MHTVRIALLCAIALLASAQPTAACPPEWYGIQAAVLLEGIPDENGMVNGRPHDNRVRIGEDILFVVKCNQASCGRDVKMELQDQTTQTKIPVSFEPIEVSDYWRVRPEEPLAAGTYLLKYTGTIESLNFIEVQNYVFRVEGDALLDAPQLEVKMDETPLFEPAGQRFICDSNSTCPGHTYQYTQLRPYARIWSQGVVLPSSDQNVLFLYRMLPAGDPLAEQNTKWEYYVNFMRVSEKRQYVRAPESCWYTQALRFSDGQITTSEVQCFANNADLADTYPGDSKPCKGGNHTAYVRAWCEDNQTSCAPDNPRAASMEMQKGCASYADACAPFIGKRADKLGICTP